MLLGEHLGSYPEDLKRTIMAISSISKTISKGFNKKRGLAGTSNIYGEEQLALDKWADQLIIDLLTEEGVVKVLASEERTDPVELDSSSDLVLTVDPLDGSSLIGVNLTVGTIIGFQRGSLMKTGKEMLGAMYILYGPLNVLVYCMGDGVHEFVLNQEGDYLLQKEDIHIPEGKIYSPGALRKDWLPYQEEWVETLEKDGYKLRYSGSFVADVHQILHKGGVFSYPAYKGSPTGKLRLLYECRPMGYIVTQAGGAVSNGVTDILSVEPENIHQRTPVYIGGKKEINLIENIRRVGKSD
jgi:fructose-1,6-bisphosphatase I